MGFFDRSGKKKSGDTTSVRKLRSQLKLFNADIQSLYTSIGEKCYKAHLEDSTPEGIDALYSAITSLNEKIASINTQIDILSGLVHCEKCGAAVPADVRFCTNCGGKMPEPPKPESEVCPQCGTVRIEGARFCENCGNAYDLPTEFIVTPVIAPAPAFTPGDEPTIAAPFVTDISAGDDEYIPTEPCIESIDDVIIDEVTNIEETIAGEPVEETVADEPVEETVADEPVEETVADDREVVSSHDAITEYCEAEPIEEAIAVEFVEEVVEEYHSAEIIEEAVADDCTAEIAEDVISVYPENDGPEDTSAPVFVENSLDDAPVTVVVEDNDDWYAEAVAIGAIDPDKDTNS